MSKVVHGLGGDAFTIAKDIRLESIKSPGDEFQHARADIITEAIGASVLPLTSNEAKELFRQCCKPTGSLSRQSGKQQYISKRRRCWKLLKELDPEIVLSEGHRADMLLDLAGLDKSERTIILGSIGNFRDFDKIVEVLLAQHLRVHLTNSCGAKRIARDAGNGIFRPKGTSKCKGKHYS